MPNQYTKLSKELDTKVEIIKSLLEDNYSVSEISKMLDYKYSSVYNCICRNGLKHLVGVEKIGKSRSFKKRYDDYNNSHPLSESVLYELYVIQQKDLYEISRIYNISASGVLYRMNIFGIPTRNKKDAIKIMYHKKPELRDVHRRNANLGLTGVFRKGNNYTNTKIEQYFEKYCVVNNIPYVKQFQITKDTHRYDFLIYEKTIVELDGLYWHDNEKQKEKDKNHIDFALTNGYNVVRFTDKEIKETKGRCFERIRQTQ